VPELHLVPEHVDVQKLPHVPADGGCVEEEEGGGQTRDITREPAGSLLVRLRKDSVFLLASLDENGETLERVEVALS
jgi:hypothetical protein